MLTKDLQRLVELRKEVGEDPSTWCRTCGTRRKEDVPITCTEWICVRCYIDRASAHREVTP